PGHPVDGRALWRPRRPDPQHHAGRADRPAPAAGPYYRLRHPRHRRGAATGGPCFRDGRAAGPYQGQRGAGRPAAALAPAPRSARAATAAGAAAGADSRRESEGVQPMSAPGRQWWGNAAWLGASLGLLLGAWQLAADRIGNPVLMPSPVAVLRDLVAMIPDGTLARDVVASLKRVFTGFFAAALLAVPLALLMAYLQP